MLRHRRNMAATERIPESLDPVIKAADAEMVGQLYHDIERQQELVTKIEEMLLS